MGQQEQDHQRRDTGKNYFSLIHIKETFPLIQAPDSTLILMYKYFYA